MSVLGHVAVGYAIARGAMGMRPISSRIRPLVTVALIGVAVLPDLDVVGEELLGMAEHRGALHSIGAAALVAGIAFVVAWWRAQPARWWAAAFFGSMASHGILDLFSPGPGVRILWPLTDARFEAPIRFLPTPPAGPDLLSPNGLVLLIAEALVFAPLVAWAWWRWRSPVGRLPLQGPR